jgi:CBS domain-containing protein
MPEDSFVVFDAMTPVGSRHTTKTSSRHTTSHGCLEAGSPTVYVAHPETDQEGGMVTDHPVIAPGDSIGQLISADPITIDEKLTLRSVAAVLTGSDIGAALVHRDNGPTGIVSERDVVRALAEDADPDTVWSADVITRELVITKESEPILRVAFRMIDEGIRHIAVVRGGVVVGVVSSRDVFAVLAEDALEAL